MLLVNKDFNPQILGYDWLNNFPVSFHNRIYLPVKHSIYRLIQNGTIHIKSYWPLRPGHVPQRQGMGKCVNFICERAR